MIITKEQQEAMVEKYVKEKHTTDECIGFIDGVQETLNLIHKLSLQNQKLKNKENDQSDQ